MFHRTSLTVQVGAILYNRVLSLSVYQACDRTAKTNEYAIDGRASGFPEELDALWETLAQEQEWLHYTIQNVPPAEIFDSHTRENPSAHDCVLKPRVIKIHDSFRALRTRQHPVSRRKKGICLLSIRWRARLFPLYRCRQAT